MKLLRKLLDEAQYHTHPIERWLFDPNRYEDFYDEIPPGRESKEQLVSALTKRFGEPRVFEEDDLIYYDWDTPRMSVEYDPDDQTVNIIAPGPIE